MLLVIERYGIPVNTIETRSEHTHPFGHFGNVCECDCFRPDNAG